MATVAAGTAVAALGAVAPASSFAASPRARVGAAAVLPDGAHVTGHARAHTRMHLTVALAPRDPVALQTFATAVSTPGSADYGDYLNLHQFAHRFGASARSLAAVKRSFRAQGLKVGAVSANQLSLKVSGTTGQVEHALATHIAQVRLANGRRAYANTTAPTLPVAVAGDVQSVVGLQDTVLDTSQIARGHARQGAAKPLTSAPQVFTGGGPQPCASASALQTMGYTGDQIATAYSVPGYYQAGDQGQGQTIAIFEEGQPYPQSDVSTFLACYGITTPVNLVPVDGGPGAYAAGTSDDTEAMLDIDNVAELAPKATLDVYSAPNTATANIDTLTAIVNGPAQVVSISYGACESQVAANVAPENTLLQQAAAEGKSVFSSSGDAGDAICSQHSTTDLTASVIDPGAQPFTTAVGGTTLSAIGPPPTEEVWNEGGDTTAGSNGHGGEQSGASGGGISTRWAMPSYQQGAAASLGVINAASIQSGTSCGSTYCRELPDVSADAAASTGYVIYSSSHERLGA